VWWWGGGVNWGGGPGLSTPQIAMYLEEEKLRLAFEDCNLL
jgi:hypothetical protein